MSDEEDTVHLADIPDRQAAVPSQSPRTSNLPWVNNKIILGSKPSPDPSKSPPKKCDNISNDTPQEQDFSEVCRRCKVRFADRGALAAHILKEIAVFKTLKRKIEPAIDGKECQLTKQSDVGKVGKRSQEEIISEARNRQNEASTSKIDSIHQKSSTKSHAHEKMKKLKIARKLQVEASSKIPKKREHGESAKPVSIRPEIKESLSLQNKPSSSWEPDIVNQKNKPAKAMKKERLSNCDGSKARAPRNAVLKKKTSTEKICTTCKKKFMYKKSFQSHVLQCTYKIQPKYFRTQNVLYQCPPCNIHYRTHQGLKRHVQRGHSDCDRILKCDACNIFLLSRAYSHHINIQHKVMEYELKDLCIKHVSGQSLHNNDKPTKHTSNGSVKRPSKSTGLNTQHAKDQNQSFPKGKSPSNKTTTNYCISKPIETIEKAKDNIILTPKETNEESSEAPDISPNIIYKCQKCNVHFVTKTALKNHHSQQNCPDIETSDEVGKCLRCKLVFYTECIIEHNATQHICNNFKTSNDFVIICNETDENQSHDTPTKQTQTTKRLTNPDEAEVPLSKKKTFETDVDCYRKTDKTVSVKSLAEAWIYKKYHERLNVADSSSILLYRCHKCSLNFLNDDDVKMHLSTCNGESGKWHQCPMCRYSFSESSLDLHVYIHHAKMELKRENFEIVSSESLHCPITAKSPQSLNNQNQRGDNALKNDISKNNSDVTLMISQDVKPGECVDSLDETKDMILASKTSNKSSREKIAYAIESIDNPNEEKPLVKINEANSILNKSELNDNVFTKKNEHLYRSSSLLKQCVFNETGHVSSTLAVNPIDKPNVKNTYNENKVLTDKLTEGIVSVVTSIDSPKQSKKKIHLFKCHICPIHFMTKKTLDSHIFNDNHHENGKKCNYCNLIFHKKTIKKHVTNHHKKFNQTVIFPCVISEYFNENQKGNVDLTLKQKSNMKKLPNISKQTNFTGINVERASNAIKDAAELEMSNRHENSTKPNVNDLAKNLNSNISEIIDLSNSQGLENDPIADPVTRCNKDSPNPRNSDVSHYSNSHNDKNKLTQITKRRTKSQDQREFSGQREVTSNYSRNSKTVTNNVNTGTNDKNEGGIITVESNMNEKSEFSALSHLRLYNNIEIIPIHPKESPNIETKTQQKSVNHAPIKHAKRGIGLDGVEKIQDKYLKPSYYSHKSSNESRSSITTVTSSNQNSHRGLSSRIAYEDSSYEIIRRNEGPHKIPEAKKSQRKSLDNPSPGERHEFLTAQNQQTTSTVSTSNSTPRKDSRDIIMITEETIDGTAIDGTRNNGSEQNMSTALGIQSRRKSVATNGSGVKPAANNNTETPRNNITVQHRRPSNNTLEQNKNTALSIHNRRKSFVTTSSDMPNTSVAPPQPTTINNTEPQRKNVTMQNGILPKKHSEQNMSIAFDVQNTRKSVTINGSGTPKAPVAYHQSAAKNNTETLRNNIIVQHGRPSNNASEQNMSTALGIQSRRNSVATNGSGIPKTPVAPPQPATNKNITVQNGILSKTISEQNIGTAFDAQNTRKSVAMNGSGVPKTPVASHQPATNNNTETPRKNIIVQHGRPSSNASEKNMSTAFDVQNRRKSVGSVGTNVGTNHNTVGRLPYNAFDQNSYPAFGVQNIRQSLATTDTGIPNTSLGPPLPANFNLDNLYGTAFLHNLRVALLQSMSFQTPGYLNVQNQPKPNPNQYKKRQPKTQKKSDIFDSMSSCPICKYSDRVSSVKQHLRVKRGYFSCCFCARKSAYSELEAHIKICGSHPIPPTLTIGSGPRVEL